MLTATDIARVCHEANRAYCMGIGDHSIPAWDVAPEWQRASAIAGVEAHLAKPLSPRESHESWLKAKEAAGWKYGPMKRPEVLEHPCMVSYDQLPLEQQLKDHLFAAVVGALTDSLLKDAPAVLPPVSDEQVVKAVEEHEAEHKDEPADAPAIELGAGVSLKKKNRKG